MGETIASGIRVRSSECLWPILFLYRASINNNFISENGIVAVLGHEDHAVGRSHILICSPIELATGAVTTAEKVRRWLFEAEQRVAKVAARLGVQSPAMVSLKSLECGRADCPPL